MTLLERICAAEAGSRELDAEIAKVLGWQVLYHRFDPSDREPYYQPVPEYSWKAVPAYTTSVDCALSLVPDGLVWNVMTDFGLPGRARLWGSVLPSQVQDRGWNADASTPALAICAAAIQARTA